MRLPGSAAHSSRKWAWRSSAIAEREARLGADGLVDQSHSAGSPCGYGPTVKPTKHAPSSSSLTGSPVPMLRLGSVPPLQSGSSSGDVVTDLPGAARLPHQQLP